MPSRRSVCAALVGGVIALSGLAAPATSAVASPPTPVATATADDNHVKYYIVGDPVHGQREYLFAIAAKTLGDGRRFREIYELNRGRQQPDGGSLTDPSVLHAGWILILPDDAEGSGIRTAVRSSLDVAAGRLSNAPENPGGPGSFTMVGRGLALVAVVALLALALRLLRQGRRLDLPRRPQAPRNPRGAATTVAAPPPQRTRSRQRPSLRPPQ